MNRKQRRADASRRRSTEPARAPRPGAEDRRRTVARVAERARALRAAGDTSRAVSSYRQAIEIDPTIAALHNNLGNALLDLGDHRAAAAAYRQALKIDSLQADAHSNLGMALREAGRSGDAIASCRRAVELAPGRPELHENLVTVLDGSGRIDEAAEVLDTAIRLCPREARLHSQRARLLIKTGDIAAAEAALRDALAVDPDCAVAHFELADIKTFSADDPDLTQLQKVVAAAADRPQSDRTDLHFALAKAYEDAGRYDDAFEELQRGNRLMRQALPYDAKAQARLFEAIASVFDRTLLDRLSGAGDPSNRPVFVVGMPRSGTTLVERILGAHPLVHGAGELRTLSEIARGGAAPGNPVAALEPLAGLRAKQCRSMGAEYVRQVRKLAPDAERIVDKMPSNFLRIGLISVILPHARIIHCRREPADTCLSCYAQKFNRGQAFSYDLRDLGHYYRLYLQLMEHWRAVLPGHVLDVDYEKLVADPEAEARRMVEFCGLPWDPSCLEFHKDRSPVRTASASQVRRPVYRSSVARWRRFEPHLEPLLEALAGDRVKPFPSSTRL